MSEPRENPGTPNSFLGDVRREIDGVQTPQDGVTEIFSPILTGPVTDHPTGVVRTFVQALQQERNNNTQVLGV